MSKVSERRALLLVEDDPLVAEHLIEALNGHDGFHVVARAASIEAARELLRPDIALVLLDIGLPDGSGLDLVPVIKQRIPARVLILTSFGDRETVIAALEAGADGYLLKDSDSNTLIQGIEVTLDGGAPISPAAAVFLLERLRPSAPDAGEALTEREVELLRGFARGASYKEAARDLGISPLTVGTHVKAIYRKLAVHSRGEAVWQAVRQGRINLD